MQRMGRGYLIAGFLAWVTFGSQPSEAQFTANFQTNIISGVTSNWAGPTYFVGNTNFADVLIIENGARLRDSNGWLGYTAAASNNIAIVSGSGSVWSNTDGGNSITVGIEGGGNSLIITNGGRVVSVGGAIGSDLGGNNAVLITDTGSVWNIQGILGIQGNLAVGNYGASNRVVISNGGQLAAGGQVLVGGQSYSNSLVVTDPGSVCSNNGTLSISSLYGNNTLVISNGGQVVNITAYVGDAPISGSNTVRVVDGGGWRNNSLFVGYAGSSNSLVVAGGSVLAMNLVIGSALATCDNLVELDSGSVTVTNAAHTAVLEARKGELVVNGGVLQADTLVITNPCAQFIHTGGTLIVSNVVVDPNTFRIVSMTPQGNDLFVTWMMAPGLTNALQATSGDVNGDYNATGFTDIFVVTNNTAVGTVTNFLDVGALSNGPTRYYRARLAP